MEVVCAVDKSAGHRLKAIKMTLIIMLCTRWDSPLRAALRWALWAWSKTVYITDSQQVKSGIEAINSSRKEEKTEVTQRPLEENRCRAASQRLGESQS